LDRGRDLPSYIGLWFFSILTLFSIAMRIDSDPLFTVISTIVALVIANLSFFSSHFINYWFSVLIYSIAFLSLSITMVLPIEKNSIYTIIINSISIATLFTTIMISFPRYTDKLSNIFRLSTSIAIFFSIILGLSIGTPNTSVYIALSILDLVVSIVILSEEFNWVRGVAVGITSFASIHLHPTLKLNLPTFAVLLTIHIVRNIFYISKKPIYARAIAVLDIVTRSVVVRLL